MRTMMQRLYGGGTFLEELRNFLPEITDLRGRRTVNRSCKIYRICPFLDDQGIIRVGGQIGKNVDVLPL